MIGANIVENNNTLSGFHIKGTDGDALKLHPKKYTWHIPKHMRELMIQPGDIVAVGKIKTPVLVATVFREDLEDTGKRYKSIRTMIEKAPQTYK